jgi:hypothetical protein
VPVALSVLCDSPHSGRSSGRRRRPRLAWPLNTMWCPFRMGTWCFGLEKHEASPRSKCFVCGTVANSIDVWKAGRLSCGKTPRPAVDREETRLFIPESPNALSHTELFELHYQSATHRRCVDFLVRCKSHSLSIKTRFSDFLDPLIENLISQVDRDLISRQMYLYLRNGAAQPLASALTMLHSSMKREIQSLLTLACCKQLCVSLARVKPFDSPAAFSNEEEMRLFLCRRQDTWKQHKSAVLAGGQVGLIVSLVLPFLPEFVPTEFSDHLTEARPSKRPRTQETSSVSD